MMYIPPKRRTVAEQDNCYNSGDRVLRLAIVVAERLVTLAPLARSSSSSCCRFGRLPLDVGHIRCDVVCTHMEGGRSYGVVSDMVLRILFRSANITKSITPFAFPEVFNIET